MDAQTIGLIVTSSISLISAIAAAMSAVRRSELQSLERRVATLEADLEEERKAHAVTRGKLAEAYAALQAAIAGRPLPLAAPARG